MEFATKYVRFSNHFTAGALQTLKGWEAQLVVKAALGLTTSLR